VKKGEEIKKLIPQREPFIMVDGFEEGDGNSAVTTLCVSHNNYFMLPDGTMAETGLIEHLAQSCSALAGAQAQDAEHPPVGLIGEVKHFKCYRRPRTGERVKSTVTFGLTFGNVTLATGQAYVDEELIADINLKIFMQ
jgi:3-hydroxymyristoyl/3-hydroxydecanoyl-(acyl carrier protein) dehydratase